MRVLRAAEHRRMPWKNGGGETIEIAVSPEGAGIDAFDWRVSMAQVASDGPFSVFPGVDRTLTILDGAGLRLTVGEGAEVELVAGSDPLRFSADAPASARLIGGTVVDLNVMTRRKVWEHSVRRLAVSGHERVGLDDIGLVLCRSSAVRVHAASGEIGLGRDDAVLTEGRGTLELSADHPAAVILVGIGRVRSGNGAG